jgi:hypothetical protein
MRKAYRWEQGGSQRPGLIPSAQLTPSCDRLVYASESVASLTGVATGRPDEERIALQWWGAGHGLKELNNRGRAEALLTLWRDRRAGLVDQTDLEGQIYDIHPDLVRTATSPTVRR